MTRWTPRRQSPPHRPARSSDPALFPVLLFALFIALLAPACVPGGDPPAGEATGAASVEPARTSAEDSSRDAEIAADIDANEPADDGCDPDGPTWCVSTPSAQGLDPELLERGIDALRTQRGVRTLLVARHGRLVVEESFGASGANRRVHDIKSASKSLLALLVGIAIERGDLEGVDQTLGELLPERYREALSAEKRAITLADLLAMEAGLESTSGENYGAWVSSADWTRAALDQPLVATPGERYIYSTGTTHLVGVLLAEATGRPLRELAREWLFEPLAIDDSRWTRSPEGYDLGGNGTAMAPRDLARVGQLMLFEGRWNGEQVVPREWVERVTTRHAEGWPERYGAYGWFWWLPREDAYAAIGYGGQLLVVVPRLDMLAVLTSTHTAKGAAWDREVFRIFEEQIFAAAEGG